MAKTNAKPSIYGDETPEDLVPFDELTSKDARVVFTNATRNRIRRAVEQTSTIVAARVRNAERPHDVATRQGLLLELKEIATAISQGLPEDVRAAYLSAAASMILLAEAADRPPEAPAYVVRNGRRS